MKHLHRPATRTASTVAVVVATALLAVPVTAASASAGDDREVRARHACATGRIEVKAEADDGRLEVEGEVDTNRRGQSWAWTMRRDGTVVARGTGVTAGPSGSFDVERRIADPAGSDRIVFRAVRGNTVCSVGATF